MFFATSKNLSKDVESPHFLTFSAKCRKCKIAKRDCHGKYKNCHGKVMKKYFVKSVGTLIMCKNKKGWGYVSHKLGLLSWYLCWPPGGEPAARDLGAARLPGQAPGGL